MIAIALPILESKAQDPATATAMEQIGPKQADDLLEIQKRVVAIADKTIACTVQLRIGKGIASGVVVSPDGYVLTAAHFAFRPGRTVEFTFPDGRIAKGKTLGFHRDVDGAVAKITDQGEWPFAPLVTRQHDAKAGDWCVGTGHTRGFKKDRAPPVRLGRVILACDVGIQTDCIITNGDSGGPLFDLRGHVIGVHSRNGNPTFLNVHAPAFAFREAWDYLKASKVFPASRFVRRFDVNRDGEIIRSEITDPFMRSVFDRLADSFNLDPNLRYSTAELGESLAWTVLPSRHFDEHGLVKPSFDELSILPAQQYLRGTNILQVCRPVVAKASKSTVEVLCDGTVVALGTIVDSSGLLITKASQLNGAIRCQLHDGRNVAARLVQVDSQHDVALLQLDASQMPAVQWHTPASQVGKLLMASGPSADPISVGIVSVAPRLIPRTPGAFGVKANPNDDGEGVLIDEVLLETGAAEAGFQARDVITHVAGARVRDLEEMKTAVAKFHIGDRVPVALTRNDQRIDASVVVRMAEDPYDDDTQSRRRDDFPSAFQHDLVVPPTQCGGPIVDLTGNVVGISIATVERSVGYAMPSNTIVALLETFKIGRRDEPFR